MSTSIEDKQKEQELSKSKVRVLVTYAAAGFLFIGGPLMIIALFLTDKPNLANSMFMAILPVSAAVISFWFAGRSVKQSVGDNSNNSG